MSKSKFEDYVNSNDFLVSSHSYRSLHKDIRPLNSALSSLLIEVKAEPDEKYIKIRLPFVCDYLSIKSSFTMSKDGVFHEENDLDYFLIDERAKKSRLTNKVYKLGLSYALKKMNIDERDIITDILKDFLHKKTLLPSDWEEVDNELFECFLLSSNRLNRFVAIAPNLYKLSDSLGSLACSVTEPDFEKEFLRFHLLKFIKDFNGVNLFNPC